MIACLICGVAVAANAQGVYDFSRVDRLLRDSLPQLGRGCALVLVKDGEVIYRASFGKYSADTIVPIASASKWISAAVIMTLVDDGRLSLDDTVGRFFPSVTGATARITLRQLLSHTSGIPGEASCLNKDNTTLAECADAILALPLEFPPGTAFAYGGSSMQVAGRIAEIVSGMPWDTLFALRIAQPLGFAGTHYDGLGVTDNPRIAGGAASSADDYGKFVDMIVHRGLAGGVRVLSESAIVEMQRDQTFGVPLIGTPYAGYADLDSTLPATRYGLGEWRERADSASVAAWEISSQGAFGFSPWVDNQRGYGGALSVRTLMRSVAPTYFELKRILHEIIPVQVPSAVGTDRSIGANRTAELEPNVPNPFSGATEIRFSLPCSQPVVLELQDLLGRPIARLVDAEFAAGPHQVTVTGEMLARAGMAHGGALLCILRTPDAVCARLMHLQQ